MDQLTMGSIFASLRIANLREMRAKTETASSQDAGFSAFPRKPGREGERGAGGVSDMTEYLCLGAGGVGSYWP